MGKLLPKSVDEYYNKLYSNREQELNFALASNDILLGICETLYFNFKKLDFEPRLSYNSLYRNTCMVLKARKAMKSNLEERVFERNLEDLINERLVEKKDDVYWLTEEGEERYQGVCKLIEAQRDWDEWQKRNPL